MARIGKITVFVDETRAGHVLTVRTVGKKGPLLLNDQNMVLTFNYVNAGTTSAKYWDATLNEVVAAIV